MVEAKAFDDSCFFRFVCHVSISRLSCHILLCQRQQVAALVGDIQGGVHPDGGVVATAIDVTGTTAFQLQIGLVDFRHIKWGTADSNDLVTLFGDIVALIIAQRDAVFVCICEVTIAAAIDRTDDDRIFLNGLATHNLRRTAGADEAVPSVVDDVHIGFSINRCHTFSFSVFFGRYIVFQFRWYFLVHGCRCADSARDVVTAIY